MASQRDSDTASGSIFHYDGLATANEHSAYLLLCLGIASLNSEMQTADLAYVMPVRTKQRGDAILILYIACDIDCVYMQLCNISNCINRTKYQKDNE